MINHFLNKVHENFFLSGVEKKLFNYFYKNKKHSDKNSHLVLVQCVESYFYLGVFGEIVSSLREKKDIRVEQYVVRGLTLGATSSIRGYTTCLLFSNRFKDNKWIKLYSSYCDNVAYRHEGSSNIIFDLKAWYRAYKIYKKIISKEQLLSLSIENIKIGDLVYDSYLRFKPAPTVNINDFYLCIVIWQAIRDIYMTNRYFSEKKPSILLTSYSTYIQHGITVRIATNFDTKIYSFGNFQTFSKELTKYDWYHTSAYRQYKENFENLPDSKCALENAKSALEIKLSGGIDTSTAYMKKSAYELSELNIPYVKDHVVVFLHDFYDSPHVYGDMLFTDFFEWVEFTLKILEKENIPYYLKPHPNQIEDSQKVIDTMKMKYKNINIISSKITNRQLVEAGIKVGISVYGTVAHELVYMGVPIILCGDNPHSSYDFCFEAKSKDEYVSLIKRYSNLKLRDNAKKEVESFYYMHNLNSSEDEKALMNEFVSLYKYCIQKDTVFDPMKYFKLLGAIKNNNAYIEYITKELDGNIN